MTPQDALAALARRTGTALVFSELGLCRLRFDGRFVVDLEVADDNKAIFLYSRLGRLPGGEQGRDLLERMMRAHCLGRETGRAVFSLDEEQVMAFVRVELPGAKEDVLFTELEEFLDILAEWADALN